MPLAQVLAQQETAVSDARVSQLSECKFLSEQEVIELAAKCKVGTAVSCFMQLAGMPTTYSHTPHAGLQHGFFQKHLLILCGPCCSV